MIILLSRLLYRQKYNRTEKISFHEIEGINEQNGTYFETFIAIESKNTVISTLHISRNGRGIHWKGRYIHLLEF